MSLIITGEDVVGLGTRLRAGTSGVRIPAGLRHLSFLQIVQTSSGTHPASYSMAPEFFHWEESSRDVKLTPDLRLVQKSKITLFPL
jgi:hypothetical protein